jgi:DNA-binding NtrC family response regulator
MTQRPVLIVDDDADATFLLGALLERLHLDVQGSNSLADGREKLSAFKPAVVLCDKYLGDGDGLDLFRHGRPAFVRMALLLSGEETLARALRAAHFDGQHRKPVDAKRLGELVRAQFDF